VRARNLELLERLNPGRIFRIRMPVDELMRRWVAQLRPEDRTHMDTDRRLELVNLMLPTRLFVAELDPTVSTQLAALVQHAPQGAAQPSELEPMRTAFEALLDRVSHGIYPVRDGALQFTEFTAVYPVGTWNEYTTHNGRQIPAYPTPGRRA